MKFAYLPLQIIPLYLAGQEQINPPSSALQVPPCWHGFDRQLSTTENKNLFHESGLICSNTGFVGMFNTLPDPSFRLFKLLFSFNVTVFSEAEQVFFTYF